MNTTASHCRVCQGETRAFRARELHFGLGDTFDYLECQRCQTLQIAHIPADLSRYYPADYYSYASPQSPPPGVSRAGSLRALPGFARLCLALAGSEAVTPDGTPIQRSAGPFRLPALKPFFRFLSAPWILSSLALLPLGPNSRVLDVGSGGGVLVYDVAELGVAEAVGIDPMLPEDRVLGNGARVLRRDLAEISGLWDIIMLHHVFEHVPEPLETLHQVRARLTDGGVCLIRTPIVPNSAWSRYGACWVQLDAPRHLFVHSLAGITLLARAAGLNITAVRYDSTDLQFWGSEQYLHGVSLVDSRSYGVNPQHPLFSETRLMSFRRAATRLNARRMGDQAAIYLTRS